MKSWYRLIVRTVGLPGTVNLGQTYHMERACIRCGAGAVPVAPLLIDATQMGSKALDTTAHDGRLVVSRGLADRLRSLRFTGFQSFPVAHKTKTKIRSIPEYEWLEPMREWPPLGADSVLVREDVCPDCGRSGHFDSATPVTSLHYPKPFHDAGDLSATFEYFGEWRRRGVGASNVGGGRLSIVSDRLRSTLVDAGVKHVQFAPIEIGHNDA